MKNIGKRALCLLFAAVLLLSMVVVSEWDAQATEEQNQWPGHVLFAYDYTNLSGENKDVEDADAYNGWAKKYEGMNLTSSHKMNITIYDRGATQAAGTTITHKLCELPAADVLIGQGYQTYSFSITVPTGLTSDLPYVYFVDSWGVNNPQMAKDLRTIEGKTVTLSISMKAEGTTTAATLYFDRMQITDTCEDRMSADGTYCTACGKTFDSPHLRYSYDYTNFAGGGDEKEIDDADAYQGKAKIYTGVKLDAASTPLYRYEAGNPEFQYQYMKLGTIAKEDWKVGQGYQTYRFETVLPAEGMQGPGNTVYLTDNWTIKNDQMAKDLYALAGKTVTITLSMKIEGELSGATVSVDRMQIIDSCEDNLNEDGTQCTVCGKVFESEVDPSAHDLFVYDISHFNGTEVEDAEADQGKAKSFQEINLTAGGAIKIYRYDPGCTEFSLQYLSIGNLPATDILADQGYQTYEFEVTLPAEGMTDKAPFVYFTDNWAVQNAQMAKDLKTLAGKKVTLVLSMKVTGDLTNATVYVDSARLIDKCEDHMSEDGSHCTACGKVFETEVELGIHDLFVYDFSHFNGTEVADEEAAKGNAKSFPGINLTAGGAVKIYRYDPGCTEFDLQYMNLGNLPAAQILVDQGYQTYRFETTLPAEGMTDKAPFVYFTDNWAVQNAQMAKDLKTLAGRNVGLILSMKVTGDLTNATVYVDGARLIELCSDFASEDGTVCTKCGADLTTEPEQPIEPPTEPDATMPETGFVYTADDFTLALSESNGDCVMEDSTSVYGKAAVLSYETRAAATNNNEGSLNDLLRTGNKTQKLYIYGGDPAQSRLINQFTVAQLQENAAVGEYVEYTVRDFDLIPTNHNYYFYMFDSWGFKLNMPSSHQKAIHNQGYVDITISMKLTGNVADKTDPPTYYIDYISIKPAESGAVIHRHEYGEWTAAQLSHSATCATCGEVNTEFHKWDDGVVTKEYTGAEKGEKLFTCTVCGATKTEEYDNRVRFVFHADSFHLPTKPDRIANDSTSSFGMAAVMSYADHKAYGNNGKALLREGNQRLAFYSYGGNPKTSYKIGELAVENLIENARGGKYVTYKFKGIKIAPVDGTYFLYMFDSWQFQLPLKPAQVQAMLGKRMDVFLSMKVTGRPNSTSNPVTYYIDEIIIQETSSEGDHLIPYVPEIILPFTTLPAEYKAENFRLPLADYGSGDAVVDDPTSAYGKAVMLSYEKRLAYNGTGKEMIRVPGQAIRLYTDTATLVGEFTCAELQTNAEGGQYVVYEFKHQNLAGAKFMYMFDCWGFQIPMEGLTGALTDKLVDVKVSMKVTGDVTSKEENTPAYYIDYISITESEPIPEHEHVYENWVTDVLSHSAKCSVCSIKLEGFHIWDDGVVTREATSEEDGEIVYTCKVCQMKDAKKIKKIKTEEPVVEEPAPEPINFGLIIGIAAGGLGGLILLAGILVLVVVLLKKKR